MIEVMLMKRLLESIGEELGSIDGYDLISIGLVKAKAEGFFDELKKKDSSIQETVCNTIKNGKGYCLGVVKKKVLYGVYLFEIKQKEDFRELNHVTTLFSDEVPSESKKKYDEFVEKTLKDFVTSLEYDKVKLEDKVIELDPKDNGLFQTAGISIIGYACGFILGWIVFDDILWGFLYGIIFMPLFNEVNVVVRNKRGRKKDNNKK
jgi:hypothetical protein